MEEWFDGIDRAAIWHRRVAITGLVLLAPHILLSSNPQGTMLGGPLGVIGAIGLVVLARRPRHDTDPRSTLAHGLGRADLFGRVW